MDGSHLEDGDNEARVRKEDEKHIATTATSEDWLTVADDLQVKRDQAEQDVWKYLRDLKRSAAVRRAPAEPCPASA